MSLGKQYMIYTYSSHQLLVIHCSWFQVCFQCMKNHPLLASPWPSPCRRGSGTMEVFSYVLHRVLWTLRVDHEAILLWAWHHGANDWNLGDGWEPRLRMMGIRSLHLIAIWKFQSQYPKPKWSSEWYQKTGSWNFSRNLVGVVYWCIFYLSVYVPNFGITKLPKFPTNKIWRSQIAFWDPRRSRKKAELRMFDQWWDHRMATLADDENYHPKNVKEWIPYFRESAMPKLHISNYWKIMKISNGTT